MTLSPRHWAPVSVPVLLALTLSVVALPGRTFASSPSLSQSGNNTRMAACPSALWPGRKAATEVAKVVQQAVPHLYRGVPRHKQYEIVSMASLALGRQSTGVKTTVTLYRRIATRRCGPTVASRSWVVFLRFPKIKRSASLSYGIVYVARTTAGWRAWYVYH